MKPRSAKTRLLALENLPATACLVLFTLCGTAACSAAPARERTTELDPAPTALAGELLKRAGLDRGLCVVLAPVGHLPVDLARASELLVIVRDPQAGVVRDLRRQAEAAGLGIDRLFIEHGPINRLPYADNMIDTLLVTRADTALLRLLSLPEMLRVLRPGGTAIIGKASQSPGPGPDVQALRQWAGTAKTERLQAGQDAVGTWVQFLKPPLEGVDEWTHWEKGPDNNPVSVDRIIQAPYMTHFMADPLYIGMPSITLAAGGRTFLAIGHIAHHRREWDLLNKIIARNGYNGTILWERKLPEGYLVHRSAFIASAETFHMIDGDQCLMLDAQTGRETGRLRIPGVEGHWKWMAMREDVLYVMAGSPDPGPETTKGDRVLGGWSWADLSKEYYPKRMPLGFGDTMAAFDLKKKSILWKHKNEAPIDSRGLALSGNKLFLYSPDNHLRSLAADNGQVLWTTGDSDILGLIEVPGRGLISTPGFRTACLAVATPKALIIQGQTLMNVVAVSTEDGRLLWTKKKVTNNPNAIFVDGQIVLGIGPGGNHVALDPVSGEVQADLNFRKVSCTRLTASPDSFFCRGEGTLRFDRATRKTLIDGGVRPGCNDGALPANGLLYIGPWQCDCNLSLIGLVAECAAGDFQFDRVATESERLERGEGNLDQVAPFHIAAADWPTYRGNNQRSAATKAEVARAVARRWQHRPAQAHTPTAATAAGGLVFVGGSDGKMRALDSADGTLRWEFPTPCPVKMPPTIWEGRALFGSGDGSVYALEAATGRLLWRFRAAPVERHIMVYGKLTSTWPVNSGVLVHEGIAYFAAGIIDTDGTHVYALNARTGEIQWQNNSSGHLSKELRKGVSAQGNLAIHGDRLLLAGGNQVSPAPFDLKTGQCLAQPFTQGQPKANNGQFVGVFRNQSVIVGGQILYSPPDNVANKSSFVAFTGSRPQQLHNGGIPPAWDEDTLVLTNFRHGALTACDAEKVAAQLEQGAQAPRTQDRQAWLASLADGLRASGAQRWQSDLDQPNNFEAMSLVVCPNAVVAVAQHQHRVRSQPQWFLVAFDKRSGQPLYQEEIPERPLPGGLLVDKEGQAVVTLLNGNVLCFGARN